MTLLIVDQFSPFQKDKNGVVPLLDLRSVEYAEDTNLKETYCPAANMLLALRLSTVSAVTGPGISLPLPTADHVELSIANSATFAGVPSARAIEPEANKSSLLSWFKRQYPLFIPNVGNLTPPKATFVISPLIPDPIWDHWFVVTSS